MLAEIGIRYLKITHAGRLEGAKARRIKQFRESELKYIKPKKIPGAVAAGYFEPLKGKNKLNGGA
ncbi:MULTISPECIES: hypothetical protein [unclassified Akkermansia]|jgi:hypothetical protein|nr:hypothetical protein [uncultured Akkermansia sp.]